MCWRIPWKMFAFICLCWRIFRCNFRYSIFFRRWIRFDGENLNFSKEFFVTILESSSFQRKEERRALSFQWRKWLFQLKIQIKIIAHVLWAIKNFPSFIMHVTELRTAFTIRLLLEESFYIWPDSWICDPSMSWIGCVYQGVHVWQSNRFWFSAILTLIHLTDV